MSQFMLLLHESPSDFAGLSPEEIQRVIGEYTAWREGLAAQGKLALGLKLKDEGTMDYHGDLKPENIIVKPSGKIVLIPYFLKKFANTTFYSHV